MALRISKLARAPFSVKNKFESQIATQFRIDLKKT